jgi:hypothetical protein
VFEQECEDGTFIISPEKLTANDADYFSFPVALGGGMNVFQED